MLKGTCKVVKNKNTCNYAPLIEVFMQDWFIKEEEIKWMPLSTSKGANEQTTKHIIKHFQSTWRSHYVSKANHHDRQHQLRWNEFTIQPPSIV